MWQATGESDRGLVALLRAGTFSPTADWSNRPSASPKLNANASRSSGSGARLPAPSSLSSSSSSSSVGVAGTAS